MYSRVGPQISPVKTLPGELLVAATQPYTPGATGYSVAPESRPAADGTLSRKIAGLSWYVFWSCRSPLQMCAVVPGFRASQRRRAMLRRTKRNGGGGYVWPRRRFP